MFRFLATKTTDAAGRSLKHPLAAVLYAWVFGAMWMQTCSGAVFTQFARCLGASDALFGLLAAIPFMGAAVQLPVSYLIEHGVPRKRLFMVAGLTGRATWAVIGLMPWLVPAAYQLAVFVALYALAVACANTDAPCWISWISDLLPARIRGRFTSSRARLGQIVALLLPLPAALLLDRAGAPGSPAVRAVASGLLIVAGLLGMVDILCHSGVTDQPAGRRPAPAALRGAFFAPLRERNFLCLLGFSATLTFAVGFMGQYVWLYLYDVLRLTNLRANLALILLPTAVQLLAIGQVGRLIDRLGRKPVMVLSGVLIVGGAFSWALVTPDAWVLGYAIVLVATIGWPAMDIARFNVLMSLSQRRGAHAPGSAYIAWHSVTIAVGGTLSGLFGGAVASHLGAAWRGDILGWPLTYHGVLFLVSSLLRVASLLWLVGFEDVGAQHTRVAMRYLWSGIYSNLVPVAVAPLRFVRRVGAATVRLGRGRSGRVD